MEDVYKPSVDWDKREKEDTDKSNKFQELFYSNPELMQILVKLAKVTTELGKELSDYITKSNKMYADLHLSFSKLGDALEDSESRSAFYDKAEELK